MGEECVQNSSGAPAWTAVNGMHGMVCTLSDDSIEMLLFSAAATIR